MYKDKAKQRQAVKEATRRYRANLKGITEPDSAVIPVIPTMQTSVIPSEQRTGINSMITPRAKLPPKPQSHNSMMVGYVPPKPKA